MVILGKGIDTEEADKLMTMEPERSKALHNFTMPCLKWGNQRFLRCLKVNSNGEVSAVDRRSSASEEERGFIGRRRDSKLEMRRSSDRRRRDLKLSPSPVEVGSFGRESKAESDGDDGIEAVREKLMFDLQTEADKMKDAILREGLEEESRAAASPTRNLREGLDEERPAAISPAKNEAARPWNLRTRRVAGKASNGISGGDGSAGRNGGGGGGGKSFQVEVSKPYFSPLRTESKSPRFRGTVIASTSSPNSEKSERTKFSVSLSRREIEEDFMAIAGQRLHRRPKKRPKIVQKQLDNLFPGLWLTEVTADFYKVPDDPYTGKR